MVVQDLNNSRVNKYIHETVVFNKDVLRKQYNKTQYTQLINFYEVLLFV